MIEMVSAAARVTLNWGTQCIESKGNFGGMPRSRVMFCPDVEYTGTQQVRCMLRAFELVFVTAASDEDDASFGAFNIELGKAQTRCLAPTCLRWEDSVKRPEFVHAEKLVIGTISMKQQFYEKAIFTYQDDFVLFRGTLWAKSAKLSRDKCETYLTEFVRREANHLDRLSPQEYFQKPQSASSVREHIPENVRHEVWRRDEGKCTRCGGQSRLEFDHIIPIVMGGSSTARNLQLLCESCNRSKAATLGAKSSN